MEKNKSFIFKDLTPEEKEKRGILGRLIGPCASISIPTRNGRFYSESLWDKVFKEDNNSVVTEMFKNGGIPMELDHPADRLETCSDRIAAMLPEPPKKDSDGHLVCYVDLIDTPCGKIAYQLAKYGFNLGISSRGNGETVTDYSGNESVDPDSYDFQTFDLVLLPAVKEARLKLMTESLNGKTFKEAIKESLDGASPEDRKVMTETLQNLNIGYSDSKEFDNIENSVAAKDNGAQMLKTLQESLLAKEEAQGKVTELQEKLSVCYAKEASMEDELNKYKAVIRNLTESAKKVKGLENEINNLNEELKKRDEVISQTNKKVESLLDKSKFDSNRQSNLKENLLNKEDQLKQANVRLKNLSETLKKNNEEFTKEKETLKENYENLKKDYTIKKNEYSLKLSESNKLIEKYKSTAQKAVNKYIESKALILGIDKNDVMNKLPKNYSFSDIDMICEDLSNYNLQMNSLPFDIKTVKNVSINNQKELPGPLMERFDDGDVIDESLIRLANTLTQN